MLTRGYIADSACHMHATILRRFFLTHRSYLAEAELILLWKQRSARRETPTMCLLLPHVCSDDPDDVRCRDHMQNVQPLGAISACRSVIGLVCRIPVCLESVGILFDYGMVFTQSMLFNMLFDTLAVELHCVRIRSTTL
jgi:hypothetical protein